MTTKPAWACEQSIEVNVPVSVAWDFMSDVRNWSDPPAEFALDGPFASGSRGTTTMPGQAPNQWMLRDVEPGRGYTVEGGSFLENARLLVRWRFEAVSRERSRLTQRIELVGEKAPKYVGVVRAGFEPNLEPGMRRLAALMVDANASSRTAQAGNAS